MWKGNGDWRRITSLSGRLASAARQLLRPWPPLRAGFLRAAPATMQGEVSPCEPLWPASQLILAEKVRLRPRIVWYILYHDPCPASRRAWLPAFFSGGLARLGR